MTDNIEIKVVIKRSFTTIDGYAVKMTIIVPKESYKEEKESGKFIRDMTKLGEIIQSSNIEPFKHKFPNGVAYYEDKEKGVEAIVIVPFLNK